MTYDIAIIGLGPAGSTLARMLGGKMHVAAIDKKETLETGFQKPCGGLLAPDGQKALACLGLTLPKEILVDPQIFSVHTIDLDSGCSRYYQRFYINLDRHKFDLWLRDLIPPGVDVFTGARCTQVKRLAEGFEITYTAANERKTIHAKYVVGADGAASVVRKALFPNKKLNSYLSIQQWFHHNKSTPFYSCIFDSKNTDCYSWALSKNEHLIFGGAYPAKNGRARFEDQKQKLEKLGIELGSPIKTEACLVLRPMSPRDFCSGGDGAFLIGEAAGLISPSSLEGISSALNSAVILGKIVLSGCRTPNRRYQAATRKHRIKIMLKLLKCPFMYQPILRKYVMKSGISSITIQKTGEGSLGETTYH